MSQKQQILETIEKANSISKDEFLSQLKFERYEPYYRGNKLYGVEDEKGRHFRFNTLRFDKDKLDDLDKKLKVEQDELQELSSLRESSNLDMEKDNQREIEIDDVNRVDDLESEDITDELLD